MSNKRFYVVAGVAILIAVCCLHLCTDYKFGGKEVPTEITDANLYIEVKGAYDGEALVSIGTLDKYPYTTSESMDIPHNIKIYKEAPTIKGQITIPKEDMNEINKAKACVIIVEAKNHKKSINLFGGLTPGKLTIQMHEELTGVPLYPIYSSENNKYMVVLTLTSTLAFFDSITYNGKDARCRVDTIGGHSRAFFFVDVLSKNRLSNMEVTARNYDEGELSCRLEVWSTSIYNYGFEEASSLHYFDYPMTVGRNKLADYNIELKEKVTTNVIYTN